MRLSPLRPRMPRHGTIVAYLALVLAMSSPAVAAVVVKHANLANDAVWSNNVKNDTLTSADVKNGALTGIDIKDNSLTGADIVEGSLLVSRVAVKVRGNQTVQAPQSPSTSPYPLSGGTYSQPAGSSELYAGNIKVSWPAGCLLNGGAGGYRNTNVEIFVDGKSVGSAYASETTGGAFIRSYPFLTVGGGFATATTATRHVTAQASSSCDPTSTAAPNVIGVAVDVIRFR